MEAKKNKINKENIQKIKDKMKTICENETRSEKIVLDNK